jgi:hypothetical protein
MPGRWKTLITAITVSWDAAGTAGGCSTRRIGALDMSTRHLGSLRHPAARPGGPCMTCSAIGPSIPLHGVTERPGSCRRTGITDGPTIAIRGSGRLCRVDSHHLDSEHCPSITRFRISAMGGLYARLAVRQAAAVPASSSGLPGRSSRRSRWIPPTRRSARHVEPPCSTCRRSTPPGRGSGNVSKSGGQPEGSPASAWSAIGPSFAT